MSLAEQTRPAAGWDGRLVQVGWAHNESEANLISGMLMTEGVPSMITRDRSADVPDFLAAAPRAIMVSARDEAWAREVLAPVESTPEHAGPLRPRWVRVIALIYLASAVLGIGGALVLNFAQLIG